MKQCQMYLYMQLKEEVYDVFYFGIQEFAIDAGFFCERIGNEFFLGNVLIQIKHKIKKLCCYCRFNWF
jgi:hypothetical protein